MAMDDQTMTQVIGGHANRDPVPHNDPDFETLHLPAELCENRHAVIESDAVVSTTRGIGNLTFKLYEIFSWQALLPLRESNLGFAS